jgi:hypothetical protein
VGQNEKGKSDNMAKNLLARQKYTGVKIRNQKIKRD